MTDQHAEAERFIAQYSDEVETTMQAVIAAGGRFLSGVARQIFNEEEADAARQALEQRDTQGFFLLFRMRASEFGADARDAFWCMVDAINFLHDATSTHWPYYTQAKRVQALVWARADAAKVQ